MRLWQGVNLTAFLSCPHNLAFNRQTRMLANLSKVNCYNTTGFTPQQRNRIILDSAKENLKAMAYFGLVEYQTYTQFLFEHTLGLEFNDVSMMVVVMVEVVLVVMAVVVVVVVEVVVMMMVVMVMVVVVVVVIMMMMMMMMMMAVMMMMMIMMAVMMMMTMTTMMMMTLTTTMTTTMMMMMMEYQTYTQFFFEHTLGWEIDDVSMVLVVVVVVVIIHRFRYTLSLSVQCVLLLLQDFEQHTSTHVSRFNVSEADMKIVAERNHLDIEFYQFAKDLFLQRARQAYIDEDLPVPKELDAEIALSVNEEGEQDNGRGGGGGMGQGGGGGVEIEGEDVSPSDYLTAEEGNNDDNTEKKDVKGSEREEEYDDYDDGPVGPLGGTDSRSRLGGGAGSLSQPPSKQQQQQQQSSSFVRDPKHNPHPESLTQKGGEKDKEGTDRDNNGDRDDVDNGDKNGEADGRGGERDERGGKPKYLELDFDRALADKQRKLLLKRGGENVRGPAQSAERNFQRKRRSISGFHSQLSLKDGYR
jgi:hypothetical protein